MSEDAIPEPAGTPAPASGSASRSGGSLGWKAAIGLAISAGLLWYVFRNEDLGALVREIRSADPLLLLAATAAATFIFWIRAWRWRAILEPACAGTSFRSRFAAVNIGFMGNNLLPLRAGEFARVYVISRLEPVPIVAAFSTLVIERLFDAVMLVTLLFGAMALPGFPAVQLGEGSIYTTAARTLAVFVACAMLILFMLVLFPKHAVAAIEVVASRTLPAGLRRPIIDALEAFLAGVSILRDARLLARALGWSIAVWMVNGLGFYLGMLAFGIDLPFVAALFLQSCVAIAVSVPSAPGFFGPFEAATHFVLVTLWGGDASQALGFALGYHIASFIPVTLMGLFYAWRMGLSLKGLTRTEEVVEEAVERESGVDPDRPRRPGSRD